MFTYALKNIRLNVRPQEEKTTAYVQGKRKMESIKIAGRSETHRIYILFIPYLCFAKRRREGFLKKFHQPLLSLPLLTLPHTWYHSSLLPISFCSRPSKIPSVNYADFQCISRFWNFYDCPSTLNPL